MYYNYDFEEIGVDDLDYINGCYLPSFVVDELIKEEERNAIDYFNDQYYIAVSPVAVV